MPRPETTSTDLEVIDELLLDGFYGLSGRRFHQEQARYPELFGGEETDFAHLRRRQNLHIRDDR
jgi:hypothetical protein